MRHFHCESREVLIRSLRFVVTVIVLFPTVSLGSDSDTLSASQSLAYARTLVSPAQRFELGFFTPGSSGRWYVGIWYKNIPDKTVVWVANRDKPLPDSSGNLTFGDGGDLVLLDRSGNLAWSSNGTKATRPVAQLLDSGNLVIRDARGADPSAYLWQSFDYPTDTLLPDMKLGGNLKSGIDWYLTAWKSADDPSSGDYVFKFDYHGVPEAYLLHDRDRVYRNGPWIGTRFSGVPEMQSSDDISFQFVANQEEVFYSFHIHNGSLLSRLAVTPAGILQRYTWISGRGVWNPYWFAPKDQCDNYLECGPYGVCDTNASPVCKCMQGFQPKNPLAWSLRDGSDGCLRKTTLNCTSDGFLRLPAMKLPETNNASIDPTMSLHDCREACSKNCSCTAYANSDVTNGGRGCIMWTTELVDMREYADGGQDLYIKVAASDLGSQGGSDKKKKIIEGAGIAGGISILLLGLVAWFAWRRKTLQGLCQRQGGPGLHERSQDLLLNDVVISSKREYSGESKRDEFELPLVDYNTIVMATGNFAQQNKLGQGGFGSVYKGELFEGQEVAVKRLSSNSGQGMEEFKNEVRLIAKLQHRNLVRLLGCCIDMDEKILIYEYMENRSLDSVIFNKAKSSLLDWQRRFNIICGIARGLLYLHQDSRFRIIHRDLKASNILLDSEWNPKISDFGMARIFGGDQIEASTRRVVGTYGYMSPEYAMDGLFSVKSDAFSFGVLVLEIVSGRKNRGFYHLDSELNLLGHAWRLWKDGDGLELVDASIGDSYSAQQVLRCIQVGLLCVQERAEDRPTMSSVVLMLGSETATMPQPKQPGFCMERNPLETDSSTSKQDESCTINQVTVTVVDAR